MTTKNITIAFALSLNRILRSLIILFPACLFNQCQQTDLMYVTLEQSNDNIRGQYTCRSACFFGNPVDLDGNGSSSTDLMQELNGMECSYLFNEPVRVFPASDYNTDSIIPVEIPMQDIHYDRIRQLYTFQNGSFGNSAFIVFAFQVDRDGMVAYNAMNDMDTSFYNESEWDIQHADYKNIHGISMTIERGVMTVRFSCSYYDFISKKMVSGISELVYERKAYAL